MLDVCLVGTGGMMPLPRRWLTALMTRYNGSSLLIDSGSSFTAVELDDSNTPIQTLVGTGDTWWYRVFKYDYSGFWFA